MYVNEVSVEARGRASDGVEIIVTEIVSATSDISYEDAWLKAHALAKEKAEATLAEKMKLLTEEVKDKLVYLKGEKGCAGSRGPQGPAGSSSTGGSYSGFQGLVPQDIADAFNMIIGKSSSKSRSPISVSNIQTIAGIFNNIVSKILSTDIVKFEASNGSMTTAISTLLMLDLISQLTAYGADLDALVTAGIIQITSDPVPNGKMVKTTGDGTQSLYDIIFAAIVITFVSNP